MFFFQILLFTVSKIGMYGLLYIYWLIHFNLEKKPEVKTGILHSETPKEKKFFDDVICLFMWGFFKESLWVVYYTPVRHVTRMIIFIASVEQ